MSLRNSLRANGSEFDSAQRFVPRGTDKEPAILESPVLRATSARTLDAAHLPLMQRTKQRNRRMQTSLGCVVRKASGFHRDRSGYPLVILMFRLSVVRHTRRSDLSNFGIGDCYTAGNDPKNSNLASGGPGIVFAGDRGYPSDPGIDRRGLSGMDRRGRRRGSSAICFQAEQSADSRLY